MASGGCSAGGRRNSDDLPPKGAKNREIKNLQGESRETVESGWPTSVTVINDIREGHLFSPQRPLEKKGVR